MRAIPLLSLLLSGWFIVPAQADEAQQHGNRNRIEIDRPETAFTKRRRPVGQVVPDIFGWGEFFAGGHGEKRFVIL